MTENLSNTRDIKSYSINIPFTSVLLAGMIGGLAAVTLNPEIALAGAAATGSTPDTFSNPLSSTPNQVINNPAIPPSSNSLPVVQPVSTLPNTIIPTNISLPVPTYPNSPIYNNGGNIGAINSGYPNNTNNCGFGAYLNVNNSGYNQTPTFSATLFANSARCPDPTRINSVTQNAETQRAKIQAEAQEKIACSPLRLEALKSNIDPDKVCPLPKERQEVVVPAN